MTKVESGAELGDARGLVKLDQVELDLQGMTCASCAARIEKKLNKLPGASATVNFATEKASVTFDPAVVSTEDMLAAVTAIGYGAELVKEEPEEEAAAGTARSHDHASELLQRLVFSAMLAVPVLLLSMIPQLEFRNWQWLAFTLATPVVFWGGLPFHKAAWASLKHFSFSMDTLISMGALAAYGWSIYALFFTKAGDQGFRMSFSFTGATSRMHPDIYLETASVVVAVILFGRYLEAKGKRRSGSAISDLASGGSVAVTVLGVDGHETLRVSRDLKVGDRFLVRAGEKVGTDGVVESGEANVDFSLLTGESLPRRVLPGDEIVGGAVNLDGRLVVRATRVGSETAMAQLAKIVADAQAKKAEVQHLVDRISSVFVPVVIALSIGTALVRFFTGDSVQAAFTAAVAVLIIACPCAMGLATPMALLVGTGRAAQLGILIRGPEVLESARRIDTVVLDKTGTVTTGRMSVVRAIPLGDTTEAELTAMAAAAEAGSRHPLAAAIMVRADELEVDVPEAKSVLAVAGQGVSAIVDQVPVVVGKLAYCQDNGLVAPGDLTRESAGTQAPVSLVYAGWGGEVRGVFEIADQIRPDSRGAINALKHLGAEVILLTGDSRQAAELVGRELAVDRVIAEVTPEGKGQVVDELLAQGKRVAMVGDGINDAAALAKATLGISVGGGTDVAKEASDLTVFGGGVAGVVDAVRIARRTLGTIRGNLFWAFAYNTAAIPLAALGLVNPVVAGTAMAFSSVFVVGNSVRLFGFRRAHID
ncbi:MAG: cation-translocating P-type ATPase [Actinomycetota bacterium]|nr:cation-translocating P-type ATPase [Actinomycetota bacterium]